MTSPSDRLATANRQLTELDLLAVRQELSEVAHRFDEEYGELRRLLERAVGSTCPVWLADEKQDLVQNALLKLMKMARKQNDSPDFPAGYVWKAGTNAVLDEIRRRRVRPENQSGDDMPEPPSPAPGPADLSLAKESGRAVQECLEAMILTRRRVLTLSLVGNKNREIAQLLSLSAKRVENLVYRGRRDLDQCLREGGFGP